MSAEPYVCKGCGRRYPDTPDPDADNCPACGEKAGPLRYCWRYEAKCHDGCNGEITFYRANGDCLCGCGKPYRDHPGCFQSRTDEATFRPDYVLRVLCNGEHVKL